MATGESRQLASVVDQFLMEIEAVVEAELPAFFDGDDNAPDQEDIIIEQDVDTEIVVPILPPQAADWDAGSSRHYRNSKWLSKNVSYLHLNAIGVCLSIMPGTSFVKYIGSCTGGTRVRKDSYIVDRSNNFYYIGIGRIHSDIVHDRFTHLSLEFQRLMESSGLIWLHHKFNLIPIKFCQLGSMYNYVLVYTIRLELPKACNRRIGEYLGHGTSFYHHGTDRFVKLGDHHSAGKVAKMSYNNVVAFLVFSRMDFVTEIYDDFLPHGPKDIWMWDHVRSMISAASDFHNIGGLTSIALISGSVCHSCVIVCNPNLAQELLSMIQSYLPEDDSYLLDGMLCKLAIAPSSSSVGSDFALMVHKDWKCIPEMKAGTLILA